MHIPSEMRLADLRALETNRLEAIAEDVARDLPDNKHFKYLQEVEKQLELRHGYRKFLDKIGLAASQVIPFDYEMLAEIYSVIQDVQEHGAIRIALGETVPGGPLGIRSCAAATTAEFAEYIVLDEKKATSEEGWCNLPAGITTTGEALLSSAGRYGFSQESFKDNLVYILELERLQTVPTPSN